MVIEMCNDITTNYKGHIQISHWHIWHNIISIIDFSYEQNCTIGQVCGSFKSLSILTLYFFLHFNLQLSLNLHFFPLKL